jgi:hypothetical protein
MGLMVAQKLLAIIVIASVHSASSPDPDALQQVATSGVSPFLACHLGLCQRRGPRSCLAESATLSEGKKIAGDRFEYVRLPDSDELSSTRAGAQNSAQSMLASAAFVAELIPLDDISADDGFTQHQPRYSTHLYLLDDLVSLRTSIVVLDPGRYHLVHGLAVAGGLAAAYFDNTGLQGEPALSKIDVSVDFDWALGAIGGLHVADYAGARWCGYLGVEDPLMTRKRPNGDRYVLWLDLGEKTDSARLWMNGTLLIDAWDRGKELLPSASVQLIPGTLSSLVLEYKHVKGPAAIRLLWSNPWTTLQPIPSRNLFHARPSGQPVTLNVQHGRLFNASLRIGPGLSILTAGSASSFKIYAQDSFRNAAGSMDMDRLILHTTYDVTQFQGSSAVALHGIEAEVDSEGGGFHGLLRLTRAGAARVEAFHGVSNALSATYYTTHDMFSYHPVQTGLWRGSIMSTASGQTSTPSLVFRDGYAARWAGFVKIPNASDFAFYTRVESTRERMKLWVDDTLIIDQWNKLETLQPSGTFKPIASNALYRFILEYHDGLNSISSELAYPGLSLEWESPAGSGTSTPRAVIPQSSFFSAMFLAAQNIQVQPGPADKWASTLISSQFQTAGLAHDFRILLRDEFGNAAQTNLYTDVVSGTNCDSEQLDALLRENDLHIEAALNRAKFCNNCALPEGYSGTVTPLKSGLSSLWALLGGFHIDGSPMNLVVSPGRVVGPKSVARGDGLSISTAGMVAQFKLIARDDQGNRAHPNPPGQFAVKIARNGSDLLRARYAGVEIVKAQAGVDMYPLDMGPLELVPQQQDASTWRLSFFLTHSGTYKIQVRWDGEDISGSPFECIIVPAPTCATTSYSSGAGISVSTAGKQAAFSIFARDEYQNTIQDHQALTGRYFVPVMYSSRPDQRPLHLGIKADDGAVHSTSFVTTRGGQHSIKVSLASTGGLAATYYSDPGLLPTGARESISREPVVDWSSQAGAYAPFWNSGSGKQEYGARWSGLFHVNYPLATTLTFFTSLRTATERVRLWVDTSLLVDQWTSLSSIQSSGTIQCASGVALYDIKLEYRDSQSFNTSQRGLQLEVMANDIRRKPMQTDFWTVDQVTDATSHRTFSANVVAYQSRVHGIGLTLLTAGVTSQLTIMARDTYGNAIDGLASWIQKSAEPIVSYVLGNHLSISTTKSGFFPFQVKLLQVGGLQATFYSDPFFSHPSISGPAQSDLGVLDVLPLRSAVEEKRTYYSVRWTGYLNIPAEGEFTFFADKSAASRLEVNGSQIFDYLPTKSSVEFGILTLRNGTQYPPYGLPITYEMRQASGEMLSDSATGISFSTLGSSKGSVTRSWLVFEESAANSPFVASVKTAPVCASRSIAYGPGLTIVTAGRLAIFFVQTKDEFSNVLENQDTTCTTSVSCQTGETLGVLAYFRPFIPGIQSRRVISSYNQDGVWDMLVIAITVSGKYFTDVSLAYNGALQATYYPSSDAVYTLSHSTNVVQMDKDVSVNTSALPSTFGHSPEGFAVRWKGFISIPCLTEESCSEKNKEAFAFQTQMTPDDRVKLWLDNILVIDQWTSLHSASPTGTLGLDVSGRLWNLDVEYKHISNETGTFDLKWKLNVQSGSAFTNVPSTKIFTASPVAGSPFPSRVWPTDQSGNYLSFSAITLLTVGTSSYFTVTARDRFDNARDYGDIFTFKTHQEGSDVPLFSPTIKKGTSDDGLFYETGQSEFLLSKVTNYISKLYFFETGGLQATYYGSSSFENPRRSSVASKIDLCPASGCGTTPLKSNLVDNTPFSVLFDGSIKPESLSSYKLKVTVKDTSDRIRLWIDNTLIIDQWSSLDSLITEADVNMMIPNAYYDITINYRHVAVGIGFGCRLEWKGGSQSTYTVITSSYFFQRYFSSPHEFRCAPAATCHSTSTATGVGLTLSTVGLQTTFTITSRDEYGNAVSKDSSRYIVSFGKGDRGLLSEAASLGSFKARQLSSKSGQNPVSVAAIRVGGLTQEKYDGTHFDASPSVSQDTQGPVDFSWSDHVLQWRTNTPNSIRWRGYLRAQSRVGMGLMATYYSDTLLQPAFAVKSVGEAGAGPIDFSCPPSGSLHHSCGMSIAEESQYSIRWSGFLRPTFSQAYTFYCHFASNEDRVRLWMDDNLLIDQWSSLSSNVTRASLNLTEDAFHSLSIHYAHIGPSNTSGLSVFWSSFHFTPRAVAEKFIFPKYYAREKIMYTLYVSGMTNAVLIVGSKVVVNASSSTDQRNEKQIWTGTIEMEMDMLYKVELQYLNAPTVGRALLEWSVPHRPTRSTIPSQLLFAEPSGRDYISGSPFEMFSLPSEPTADQSILRMKSSDIVTVGDSISFELTAMDSQGNLVPVIRDSQAFLAVLKHASKSYYSFHSTNVVSEPLRHRIIYLTNHSDLKFEGDFTTTVAGLHTVSAYLATLGGLTASYYDESSSVERRAKATRVSKGPLDWSSSSSSSAEIVASSSRARWSGFLRPAISGLFSIGTSLQTPQDRVKLWVDNMILVDGWSSGSSQLIHGTITFESMKYYEIIVDYKRSFGTDGGGVALLWKAPGSNFEHVSSEFLFSENRVDPESTAHGITFLPTKALVNLSVCCIGL